MKKEILFQGEVARTIGIQGYYATKSGKIISVKVKGGGGKLDYSKPRVHSHKVDKDGYLESCLSCVVNGVQKRIYRRNHRLVWEAFNGKIPNDLTIDHINRNVKDNNLENLRLLTREENTRIATIGNTSRRNKYKLYSNGIYLGIYDRFELFDFLGITKCDVDRYNQGKITNRIRDLDILLKKV